MLTLCGRSRIEGRMMILGHSGVPPNVMTCSSFRVDWSRGLGSVGGQSLPIPIDLRTRPYNSASTTVQHVTSVFIHHFELQFSNFNNESIKLYLNQ